MYFPAAEELAPDPAEEAGFLHQVHPEWTGDDDDEIALHVRWDTKWSAEGVRTWTEPLVSQEYDRKK